VSHIVDATTATMIAPKIEAAFTCDFIRISKINLWISR